MGCRYVGRGRIIRSCRSCQMELTVSASKTYKYSLVVDFQPVKHAQDDTLLCCLLPLANSHSHTASHLFLPKALWCHLGGLICIYAVVGLARTLCRKLYKELARYHRVSKNTNITTSRRYTGSHVRRTS